MSNTYQQVTTAMINSIHLPQILGHAMFEIGENTKIPLDEVEAEWNFLYDDGFVRLSDWSVYEESDAAPAESSCKVSIIGTRQTNQMSHAFDVLSLHSFAATDAVYCMEDMMYPTFGDDASCLAMGLIASIPVMLTIKDKDNIYVFEEGHPSITKFCTGTHIERIQDGVNILGAPTKPEEYIARDGKKFTIQERFGMEYTVTDGNGNELDLGEQGEDRGALYDFCERFGNKMKHTIELEYVENAETMNLIDSLELDILDELQYAGCKVTHKSENFRR